MNLAARLILQEFGAETAHALADVVTTTVIGGFGDDTSEAYRLAADLRTCAPNGEAAHALAFFLTVYLFRHNDEKWYD